MKLVDGDFFEEGRFLLLLQAGELFRKVHIRRDMFLESLRASLLTVEVSRTVEFLKSIEGETVAPVVNVARTTELPGKLLLLLRCWIDSVFITCVLHKAVSSS